jgi:hypothetical protein
MGDVVMAEVPPSSGQDPGAGQAREQPLAALDYIQEALKGLRFGEVTVIVQDGYIVQVERTERRRWDRKGKGK